MAVTKANVQSLLGELFQSGKRPNTFLRLIGGIQGNVMESASREFPVAVLYNLRNPSQAVALEGANAPAATTRTLTQATNVVEIHQEAVSITYLAQSDKTVSGVVPIPQAKANGPVQNPRSEAFQVQTTLDTISQDLNWAFLNGTYQNPADPSGTTLKTRGILTAITTNVVDQSGDVAGNVTAASYKAYVEKTVKTVCLANGFMPDDTWTIMAGANEYNNIQAAYESKTTPPYDREIAGLKIRQIYTRFGILNLALDPDMPDAEFGIFNLGVVGPVGLPVPEKGIMFYERLAKTGSAENGQVYGQMGLDHGPEFAHGLCKVPTGVLL